MWDRADGSPPPVEAWGFSPTKQIVSEEAFRPGLFDSPQIIALKQICHPERSRVRGPRRQVFVAGVG